MASECLVEEIGAEASQIPSEGAEQLQAVLPLHTLPPLLDCSLNHVILGLPEAIVWA